MEELLSELHDVINNCCSIYRGSTSFYDDTVSSIIIAILLSIIIESVNSESKDAARASKFF